MANDNADKPQPQFIRRGRGTQCRTKMLTRKHRATQTV